MIDVSMIIQKLLRKGFVENVDYRIVFFGIDYEIKFLIQA